MTAERVEGLVQVLIMLAIGAMAGAASFTHVHDVTVAHGQPHWIGWANAVVVELMSIALGLELRRRARTHRPIGFVATALLFFVVVSLAAQVVEAERSVIGWLAAALPAIGFLVLAKVVLSRTAAVSTTAPATTLTASAPASASAQPNTTTPAVDSDQDAQAVELVDEQTHTNPADPTVEWLDEQAGPDQIDVTAAVITPEGPSSAPVELPAHLLPTARFSVVNHEQTTGRPITKDELATRMSISPDLAGQLLHALADVPARINGAPIGGSR